MIFRVLYAESYYTGGNFFYFLLISLIKCVIVYIRIIPEFRILRLTLNRKYGNTFLDLFLDYLNEFNHLVIYILCILMNLNF